MKRKRFLRHFILLGLFLGIYKGQLALWQENAAVPESVYPCQVRMLPEADRRLLDQGIPIRSREELTSRLEDLMS